MADTDPPPPSEEYPSDPPPGTARERFRGRIESVIPEILKRAVELGVEKARESPDNLKQFVTDLKVPKEIAHYLLQQIDETKNGLFRVVAKEIRDFLEHTNFAGEMQKILTTVQFEVNTTIRFTPNDGRDRKPDKPEDGGAEGARDDAADAAEGEAGAGGGDAPRDTRDTRAEATTRLPKPEVKTAVHMRRDRPRRSRSST